MIDFHREKHYIKSDVDDDDDDDDDCWVDYYHGNSEKCGA